MPAATDAPLEGPFRSQEIRVRGIVQGVGFRPFVARLAAKFELSGWVKNDAEGVLIRVQGQAPQIGPFTRALAEQAPYAARVEQVDARELPPGEDLHLGFCIHESDEATGTRPLTIPPDLATCPDCLRELRDPSDRRHGHPFISCTHCGPRYSILRTLPYDRQNTSMRQFPLCGRCEQEYKSPSDRRFHAEPIACPQCGPRIQLLSAQGDLIAVDDEVLEQAAAALRAGLILALKGIGGFHLMVDARNTAAVLELRRRKHREAKPLAVMFPSVASLLASCEASEADLRELQSPEAPILLLPRRQADGLSGELAPGNPLLGALLPYSPLHHLLLTHFGGPLVATSGNLSEEPLCRENAEALTRLQGIADVFLCHDRPITRPIDDSVIRPALDGGRIILRRARGLAPRPLPLPREIQTARPLLCLGGHLKNTVAVHNGHQLIVSPHLGDLGTPRAMEAFRQAIDLLCNLTGARPEQVACDMHPDYASTQYAERSGLPVRRVQHHVAHLFACLGEQDTLPEDVLGVIWDGTGYGEDGSIQGGEFLQYDHRRRQVTRVGALRPFRLPGGDQAVRNPGRSALALLLALEPSLSADEALAKRLGLGVKELPVLLQLLHKAGPLAPRCSSAGRLFDGAAALLGLGVRSQFEAQTAMALEFAALRAQTSGADGVLDFPVRKGDGLQEIDWGPAITALQESRHGTGPELQAWRFHRGLADAITRLALGTGIRHVALSGGCFQNALLLHMTKSSLEQAGLRVLTHRRLPPNDGSLAFGQAVAVALLQA